ncbi:protein SIX6OS1 isoform X2 [Ascaphus truei]
MKEQIQICTADALDKKQQIRELHKNINSSDERISNFQKYSRHSRDNCTAWKPTYVVLYRHEEFLQSQLHNTIQAFENDKKMYLDSMQKYKETLRQHQEQYMGSLLAKEYYMKKQDLDDIQNRVLKWTEQLKREENNILDILAPAPFTSYKEWAFRLASLRKNTKEIHKHIALISLKTSDIMTEVKELEFKQKYVKQHIGNVAEDQSYIGSKNTIMDRTMEFQESIFEEETYLNSSNEKQPSQLLNLLCLPQKLVRPLPDIKLSLQLTGTGSEGNKSHMDQRTGSTVLSDQNQSMEQDHQKCNDLTIDKNRTQVTHLLPTTSLHNQMQLRLILSQKQTRQELKAAETEHREDELKEAPNTSKDSAYASQEILSQSYEAMEVNVAKEDALSRNFAFPRTPPSFIPRTSEISPSVTSTFARRPELSIVKKGPFPKTSTYELSQDTGEQTERSPSFNFFMASTPKTPRLNIFESSPFSSTNLPDQDESYTGLNTNTASPLKDIGNIFGKLEGDDEFAFPFASKPSQTFDDAKDDFGFTFSFGQDQRTPQESSQSTMNFTFF